VIGLLAAELVRSMTLLGATSASALPDALESANGSLA